MSFLPITHPVPFVPKSAVTVVAHVIPSRWYAIPLYTLSAHSLMECMVETAYALTNELRRMPRRGYEQVIRIVCIETWVEFMRGEVHIMIG